MASNQSRSNRLVWALCFGKGCVLSSLLFIVYMNWIDKCGQADECASIENCKINRLLFADDVVLISSTESGLQRTLNSFADTRDAAEMKISTAKSEIIHLSRYSDQWVLQMNRWILKQVEKFKYFGDLGLHSRVTEDKTKNWMVRSSEIRKSLNIEPLLLLTERLQLKWFGHVSRMPQERLPKQALLAKANGRRPVGRPRTRWTNYIKDL